MARTLVHFVLAACATVAPSASAGPATPLQFAQISAGNLRTCAVETSGDVDCWGNGNASAVPKHVSGFGSPASFVSTGSFHSCAITAAGLKCWGDNVFGQLGTGDTGYSATPVDVMGLGGDVSVVATGWINTCAVVTGSAFCWGSNQYGGNGNGEMSSTPTLLPDAVTGLGSGVTDIAVGNTSSCAVVGGGVKCWGDNSVGQLGNGGATASAVPVDVSGLQQGATRVSGTLYTFCAIVDGAAKCWGSGASGMLGDGGSSESNVPVNVLGLDADVVDITVGSSSACAQTADGTIYCWGYGFSGELGTGTYMQSANAPVGAAIDGDGLVSLSAGTDHACALRAGQAFCWGLNRSGELGLGSASLPAPEAVDVAQWQGSSTRLAAGDSGVCAARDGHAYCWGDGRFGQIGNGAYDVAGRPTQVNGLVDVSAVTVGASISCAIARGAAYCWGSGALGHGVSGESATPIAVQGLESDVSVLASGTVTTCAVHAHAALCWGSNALGELGNGSGENSLTPTLVSGLGSGVDSISVGNTHACALVSGAAKCWGGNVRGQVGVGATSPMVPEPASVPGLDSGVTQVVARDDYACAVKNGAALCWGANELARLGNGGYADSLSPHIVVGLDSGVASVSLGQQYACATLLAGGTKCWGSNGMFRGTMDSQASPTPQDAVLFPQGVTTLALGSSTTCGSTATGVFCIGYNAVGEVGNGGVPFVPTPSAVIQNDALFDDGFDPN